MMTNEKEQGNVLKAYTLLLYFSGSMIMHGPGDECISDFLKSGLLKRLPLSSSNPRFIHAASLLRNQDTSDKERCKKELNSDFNRLFAQNSLSLAPPHKSFYEKDDYQKKNGNSEGVSGFYDSYGWQSHIRDTYTDDHLGTGLLFLNRLIEYYMQLDDDACKREMRSEISRFINKHILSWVPQWQEDVMVQARTQFYKGIAELIYACTEDIVTLPGDK